MNSDRMQRLWAPWRSAYVAAPSAPAAAECFICDGLAAQDDRHHLIVRRSSHGVVMLNKYPYNNGHLLIAPRAHVARLKDLSDEAMLDCQKNLHLMINQLDQWIKPDGYNIGMNLGKVAGAGLPGHLHWHLVPRWHGDTNFMPVFTETKVIVQSLEALYEMLTESP